MFITATIKSIDHGDTTIPHREQLWYGSKKCGLPHIYSFPLKGLISGLCRYPIHGCNISEVSLAFFRLVYLICFILFIIVLKVNLRILDKRSGYRMINQGEALNRKDQLATSSYCDRCPSVLMDVALPWLSP